MKNSLRWIFLILLLPVVLLAQGFGQNKIQYERQNWKKLQSRNFDIYYYQGGRKLAEFVADEAESSYVKLSRDINYELIDRVSIIIYNSHADFSETNISPEIIPTSTGGFTEFFKNRVIIPFEGDYAKFRHVLHHELTHAVSLQFFFGSGPGAILKGISRLSLPLWFVEGMAEYMSLRWDTNSDMFLRDASLSGYLPPIPYLSSYLAYKGGQSLYYYIAETYGDKKISEMMWSVRNRRNVEAGIQDALRISLDELSDQWQTAMRKQYWPDVQDRDLPGDFAIQLTDNRKWRNFVNNSPAISPRGDKIAFLSDKSGYFDIYLISTLDKTKVTKLVDGQRAAELEDLNWLTPGMGWSNDGKYLVFSAKSGPEDVLNILDVEQKKIIKTVKPGLNAIFSPTWSPVADKIAFSGMKENGTDIYVLDVKSGEIQQLTDDLFTDMEPAWSPDGRDVYFSSDRGAFTDPGTFPENLRIQDYDYEQRDLYAVGMDGQIERLTATPDVLEISPEVAPDGRLSYISDANGIYNIYMMDLATRQTTPLTNLLTGCAQLSWSENGDRLAFTAFSGGGYNVYLWVNPLQVAADSIGLQNTAFINQLSEGIHIGDMDYVKDQAEDSQKELRTDMKARQSFSEYVFDHDFSKGMVAIDTLESLEVQLPDSVIRDEKGRYRDEMYKTRFSVDYAGGTFGYDPFWGVQGLSQIIFSDMLGNHQIGLGFEVYQSIKNSDFQLSYTYRPLRPDFSGSIYHFVDFFLSNEGLVRFRNYGIGGRVTYPISRFSRVSLGTNFFNVNEEYMDVTLKGREMHTVVPSLSYAFDNTIFGYFGPADGSRWNATMTASPSYWKNGSRFFSLSMDYRHYFLFGRDYTVALRATGGASFGKNPQRYVLGGLSNWINYRFKQRIPLDNIEDLFFSSYITPLRGSDYYEQYGSRFFLTNFETRFPFIDYLLMRVPFRMGFSNLRSVAFLDMGSAWEDDNTFQPFGHNASGNFVTEDLVVGTGVGFRVFLGFALLRIDVAWRTDFDEWSKPRWYFSLGGDL